MSILFLRLYYNNNSNPQDSGMLIETKLETIFVKKDCDVNKQRWLQVSIASEVTSFFFM